jgi:uncharacterized membrane protein YqiK
MYPVAGLVGLIFLFWLVSRWLVNVGPTQIAITERRYLGKELVAGRVFATHGEVGIQAEYLNPGLHFVAWPFVSVLKRVDFVNLGSIEDLERNVIHPQIDGIFRAQVSKSPAISYQQNRAVEQAGAEEAVREDLKKYRVEVVKAISAAGLKITPDVMVTSGGDGDRGGGSGGLVNLLLANLVQQQVARHNVPRPSAPAVPAK